MRRLSGYLLAMLATLIVLVALLVSGLRLLLPHIDSVRPQIAARLGQFIGAPLTIGELSASWHALAPCWRRATSLCGESRGCCRYGV